jgi:hypothetical protein
MSATPPLLELQQAITDYLDQDSWFDSIGILNESHGDLAVNTDILISKLGVGVVVQIPTAEVNFPDLPAIYFDQVPIIVSCYAHTELNKVSNQGTGIHPFNTAQVVAALLHQWRVEDLADAEGNAPMLIAAPKTIVPVTDELKDGVIGWDVYLITHLGFRYVPERSLADNNNNAILTNAGIEIDVN